MNRNLLIVLLAVIIWPIITRAQGGTWVWMNGPSTPNGPAVYGIQGTPSANNRPSSTYSPASWTDQNGNFWLFGGRDLSGNTYADLWKFNPSTNMWTWVKGPGSSGYSGVFGTAGVASALNNPPALIRAPLTWTDANNNLWLYGGIGGTTYDNLWEYNIITNMWTWVSGSGTLTGTANYGTKGVASSTNTPGPRCECTSNWVDNSGNLWFFGGSGSNSAFYNDMWKYNIASGLWTWMTGSNTTGSAGYYGTMGVANINNQPPARASFTNWKDPSGNFYIFGGYTGSVPLSDVWQYNPGTNLWTWVAGESTSYSSGNYGSYCVSSGSTGPASRYENRSPTVLNCPASNFYEYGGSNINAYSVDNVLSDLWIFNSQTFQWTLVAGGYVHDYAGNYGTMGVPSANNMPPARGGHLTWEDKTGNLWAFGGTDGGTNNYYSDMWKFIPSPSCVSNVGGGNDISASLQQPIICRGDSTTLTVHNITGVGIWLHGALISTDSILRVGADTTTTYMITGASSCSNSDTGYVILIVTDTGQLNYTIGNTQFCQGGGTPLSLAGQSQVQISPLTGVTEQDSADYYLNPAQTTTYQIKGVSSACLAPDSASVTVSVTPYTPIHVSVSNTVNCSYNYVYVNITGATVSSIQSTYNYYITSNTQVTFYGINSGTSNPVISLTTSCGSIYKDTLHLTWLTTGSIAATASAQAICHGDSALITVLGATGIAISPTVNQRWADSTHLWVYPDSTTTYTITGTSICSGTASANVTVSVIKPGQVPYSTSGGFCQGGGYVTIYTCGMRDFNITPSGTTTYIDSFDASTRVYFTTSGWVTITGTDICGNYDSTRVYVTDIPNAGYRLSRTEICKGDSALLALYGLHNLRITPTTGVTIVDSSADSTHIYLAPDTSVLYTITGTNCSNYNYTYSINIFTVNPGAISYTVSPTSICGSGYSEVYVRGVTQVQLTGNPLWSWSGNDAYIYLYPDSTTYYTLIATTICNQRDTSHFTVYYTPNPSTYLSKSSMCQGDSVLLTIQGIRNATISPLTNETKIDSAHFWLYPDSTATYLISGYNCSGYYTYQYVTVTVVKPGILTYTIADTAICQGYSDVLHIYGITNPVISPTVYLYTTTPDSTTWYTYLYPSATTTYTISGKSVCGGNVAATFTVHAIPNVSVTSNKSVLCNGDSAQITLNGLRNVNITPASNLSWIDSNHVEVKSDTPITYLVTGYSLCTGYYYSTSISFVTGQTGALGYSLSANPICPGMQVKLNIYSSSQPSITPYSYFYYSSFDHYYTYINPTPADSFIVTAYNVCGGYDTAVIKPVFYNDPDFVMPQSQICAGDSTMITLYNLQPHPLISPAGSVSWAGADTAWLKPDTTTIYTITGSGICGGNYVQPVTVNVNRASVTATASTTSICSNDSSQICASAGFVSYTWNTGQTTQCITAQAMGNYYVTATNANGCIAVSPPVYLNVTPEPVINITSAGGDTLMVEDEGNIQWFRNGIPIPGATTSIYVVTSPGTYTVQEITKQCGVITTQPAIVLTTGQLQVVNDGVSIYPNPTTGYLVIQTTNFTGQKIVIYDACGRIISTQPFKNEVDISALSNAVYVIEITGNEGVVRRRIIKM